MVAQKLSYVVSFTIRIAAMGKEDRKRQLVA